MKILDNIADWQLGLLFDIRRSIRYHDRRKSFFERLHHVTSFLTILMAGSVLFDLAKNGETAWWLTVFGILAALFAILDMVVSFSRQAGIHGNLKDRFSILEIEMVSGDSSEEAWLKYQRDRLNIEKDEPPIFTALDALCRNELLIAEGYSGSDYLKECISVSWFERITSNIFKWPNIIISQNSKFSPDETQTSQRKNRDEA